MKLKFTFFVAFTVFFIHICRTQPASNPNVKNSPTLEAEAAAVNNNINLFNGTLNVSLPLGNVKYHEFNLPVTLNYDGTGVLVNQPSGWLGSNWSLDINCSLTRTVRGNDDLVSAYASSCFNNKAIFSEEKRNILNTVSYLFSQENPEHTHPLVNRCEVLNVNIRNILESIVDGQTGHDLEYDIWTYSIPGHSGKFIVTENGEIIEQSNSGVIIEFYPAVANNGGISSEYFVFTNSEGFKYFFQPNEYSESIAYPNQFSFLLEPSLISETENAIHNQVTDCKPYTSYSIFKIESPFSTRKLLFSHSSYFSSAQVLTEYFTSNPISNLSCEACDDLNNNNNQGLITKRVLTMTRGYRLNAILNDSGSELVVITTSSLQDYYAMNDQEGDEFEYFPEEITGYPNSFILPENNDRRLDGVKFNDFHTGIVTRYTFEYSTDLYSSFMKIPNNRVEPDDRLYYNPALVRKFFLDKIIKKIGDGAENSYKFQYTYGKLPKIGSFKIDGFGYAKDMFENYPEQNYENELYSLNKIENLQNTPSDFASAVTGALESILYPDGSSAHFEYELHNYSYFHLFDYNPVPGGYYYPSPGLRIKSVTVYSDANSNAYANPVNSSSNRPSFNTGLKREFRYFDGALLCGVIPGTKRKVLVSKSNDNNCVCERTELAFSFMTSSFSLDNGFRVGYRRVEEWLSDVNRGTIVSPKGHREYKFSQVYDKINRLAGSFDVYDVFGATERLYNLVSNEQLGLFAPSTSYHYKNGLLEQELVYKDLSNGESELIEKTLYQYSFYNENSYYSYRPYKMANEAFQGGPRYYLTRYAWVTGNSRLDKKTTEFYRNGLTNVSEQVTLYRDAILSYNCIANTVSPTTKVYHLPRAVFVSNTGEKTRVTTYVYPNDINNKLIELEDQYQPPGPDDETCYEDFRSFLNIQNGLRFTKVGILTGTLDNFNYGDLNASLNSTVIYSAELLVPKFNSIPKCIFHFDETYSLVRNIGVSYSEFNYFSIYYNQEPASYLQRVETVKRVGNKPSYEVVNDDNLSISFVREPFFEDIVFEIVNSRHIDFAYSSFERGLLSSVVISKNLHFDLNFVQGHDFVDQSLTYQKSVTGNYSFMLNTSNSILWTLRYQPEDAFSDENQGLNSPRPQYGSTLVDFNEVKHLVTFWTTVPDMVKVVATIDSDGNNSQEIPIHKSYERNGFTLVYCYLDHTFNENFQLQLIINQNYTPVGSSVNCRQNPQPCSCLIDELRIYPYDALCQTSIRHYGAVGYSSFMSPADEASYIEYFYDVDHILHKIIRDSKSNIISDEIIKIETYEN